MSLAAPWIDYDPRVTGLAAATFTVRYMLDRGNSNRKRGFVKLTAGDTGWFEIQPLPFLTMASFAGALDYDPTVTGLAGAVGTCWLGPGLGLACYYEKAGTDDLEWARISDYAGGAPAVADAGGTFHLTDQGWALGGGGGGGADVKAATLALGADAKCAFVVNVVDAAVGVGSQVQVTWGTTNDTDENSPDMDAVTFGSRPKAGSFDVLVSSATPISGALKINYLVG